MVLSGCKDLAYSEIEEGSKNNSGVDVIWDKDAAVRYITWDTNQCILYDGADTFAQEARLDQRPWDWRLFDLGF